ncbi:MAG: C2H2-type zinc finger protein, partial [Candidatus Brocadiaceae bacterium]|nr:C2H2-type zinc finger protein [Candidatus Brocadiaceae bacterium]
MDGAPVEHSTLPCEYCGKTFTRLFNLNRHIKT